jgi:opacity protein-like surface antigen
MKRFATVFLFFATAFSVNAQGLLKDYYLHTFAGATRSGDTAINGQGVDVQVGSGYSVGIAAGRSITKNFRLELEWSYRNNDVDDYVDPSGLTVLNHTFQYKLPPNLQSVSSATKDFESNITYSSILANVYYDYSPTDKLTISAGLGLGLTIAQANFFGENPYGGITLQGGSPINNYIPLPHDRKAAAFAYQVVLGVGYKVNENFSLTFAYKLFAPGEFDDIDNLYLSSFDLGATYLF